MQKRLYNFLQENNALLNTHHASNQQLMIWSPTRIDAQRDAALSTRTAAVLVRTRDELVVLSFPGPDRSIRLEDLRAGTAVSRRYRNRRIGEFLKELDLTAAGVRFSPWCRLRAWSLTSRPTTTRP